MNLLLILLLALVAPAGGGLRFVQPTQRIAMLTPGRETVVQMQAFIPRHKDNRAFRLSCRGACYATVGPTEMEGEFAEAIFPRNPVKVALDAFGEAVFTVEVFGPGGVLRDSATHTIKVCGGEEPCR